MNNIETINDKNLVAFAKIMIGNKYRNVEVFSDAAFSELNQSNVELFIRRNTELYWSPIQPLLFNNLAALIPRD